MKKIIFVVLISLFSFQVFSLTREVSFEELELQNENLAQDLKDAGFSDDEKELKLLVEEENLTLKTEELKKKNDYKNYFIASVLLSSAYIKGVSLDYQMMNKRKMKKSWSLQINHTEFLDLQSVGFQFNKFLGRSGIYIGANTQGTQFRVYPVNGAPIARMVFVGLQVGYQKDFGKNKRFSTTLQLGGEFSQNEAKNIIMPDLRLGVGYKLKRK